MDILTVPTASVSEVKKSPGEVFSRAEKANNGVYVFNHGVVAGVMLTQHQYETLNNQLDELTDKLHDAEVSRRLALSDVETFTDAEVRGLRQHLPTEIDPNDGWV